MIIEYVRYRLTGDAAAFEQAYADAAQSLDASPHCQHWSLSRCQEEPDRYILRLEWDSLDGHMQGFRKSAEFRTFLGAIRPYIDQIEEMQHYALTRVCSLHDALGGTEVIFRIAHEMHGAMCADDLLGPKFSRAAETHVPHLAMWLCEVFGGPKLYSATLGDIGLMLRRHANQNIPEPERARFAQIAHAVVAKQAEGAHPDAVKAAQAYFDWGTRVAVENSLPGHVPDVDAGVPQWGW